MSLSFANFVVVCEVCHQQAQPLTQTVIQAGDLRVDRARRLEAAGVEPASESTPSRNSTCVAALECSQPPSKSDGNRQLLAPENLAAAPRGLRDGQPAVMTSSPAQQASSRWTSLLIKQRVLAACPQLWLLPRD
jgi:hypothetical protein